jgi:hypothetical protein
VDWYRIGVPIETRTYEITGLAPAFPYQWQVLKDVLANAVEVPYEILTVGAVPQKRPIECVRALYRSNAEADMLDPRPLPLGEVESLALPCESRILAAK